jgi:dual specificity phosphatase 3
MNSPLHWANAHFVTEFLAVGGDLAESPRTARLQMRELVDVGITHVLDVRQECDDAALWAEHDCVDYRWEGIDDAGQTVPGHWFETITDWAVQAIENGGAVLTHCHMGINRGPSAGYAVLLRLGWDPVDALDAIRRARPIAAIAYAEDALRWHLDRVDASAQQRTAITARVVQWRADRPLDVVRIIRSIRLREAS